mmetsp:Transcript_38580/g.44960  ORF Transcript_38580/g.44960 Transcript_38580/m.44960 type:complete len:530 (+) Transcript_38580:20-1609(+)
MEALEAIKVFLQSTFVLERKYFFLVKSCHDIPIAQFRFPDDEPLHSLFHLTFDETWNLLEAAGLCKTMKNGRQLISSEWESMIASLPTSTSCSKVSFFKKKMKISAKYRTIHFLHVGLDTADKDNVIEVSMRKFAELKSNLRQVLCLDTSSSQDSRKRSRPLDGISPASNQVDTHEQPVFRIDTDLPPEQHQHQKPVIRTRHVKSKRRKDGLVKHAYNITSQCGEDGILNRIFKLLPPPLSLKSSSSSGGSDIYWCVDVGAWDGKHLSNTYSLLTNDPQFTQPSTILTNGSDSMSELSIPDHIGSNMNYDYQMKRQEQQTKHRRWRGILIEEHPDQFEILLASHQPLDNICVNEMICCTDNEQLLTSRSLTSVLSRVATVENVLLPSNFDLLCIDVDGIDYWLLHNILNCGKYFPRVICVEFNPTIPDSVIYIPPQNELVRHGCSLAALVELASSHSYTLVETTTYNAFFVTNDLYEEYLKEEVGDDTSIETLHEATEVPLMYQLYDGSSVVRSCFGIAYPLMRRRRAC